MLLDELRSLNEVNLAICFDEVVAHAVNVIDDDQLDVFLLDPLGKVKEDLIVIFNVLAKLHDDVVSDSGLSDHWLVLNQEILFHLIESLLIEVLASYHKEGLASKASLLLRED